MKRTNECLLESSSTVDATSELFLNRESWIFLFIVG